MTGFAGFPSGKNPYVPVPEVFFTVLLPEIEDSAELKVTLHLFWLLAQKKGNPRCVSDHDLLADQILLRSLKRRGDPRPPEERLRQGLELALARGTLLQIHLRLVSEGNDLAEIIQWYFFNTARSRKVVDELQGGEMVPARLLTAEHEQVEQESEIPVPAGAYTSNKGAETPRNIQVEIVRPNIFKLYEDNIGLLTPLVADHLRDAADHYPEEWIEAAFREAVQHNIRKWSYISAILRNWETEGR
ncbi:MAG: DnaD domain-containing protein [Ktedonobacteraceae bacterium]|jgi:DNA replication protein